MSVKMSGNLKTFLSLSAAASLLLGTAGFNFSRKLPEPTEVRQSYSGQLLGYDLSKDGIIVRPSISYDDNGNMLYVVPDGYGIYPSNYEDEIGIIAVFRLPDGMMGYAPPVGYDLSGYVGVNEEYSRCFQHYLMLQALQASGEKLTTEELSFLNTMGDLLVKGGLDFGITKN